MLNEVDLGALEDHPDGEALLDAMWQATAGDDSGALLAARLAGHQLP